MKTTWLFLGALFALFAVGCRTAEPASKPTNPDPVDFAWIKSAKRVELTMANIYFYGAENGKYVEKGKWIGTITGDIFCKPKPEKLLGHGLYLRNCAIRVNEDGGINLITPKNTPFLGNGNIFFENGKVVIHTSGGKAPTTVTGDRFRIYNDEIQEAKPGVK